MTANWEKLLKFRCTGCGNCCRGTYIIITDADLRRLITASGRDPFDIVQFVGADEVQFNKRHAWWIHLQGRRAVMALRWQRGTCTFLDTDNRCTVYEERPLVCRLHPFDVTLTDADRGAIAKLSLSRIVACPHAWDGNETKRNLGMIERQLWRESDHYIARVNAWNRESTARRTPRQFLRYLTESADKQALGAAPQAVAG